MYANINQWVIDEVFQPGPGQHTWRRHLLFRNAVQIQQIPDESRPRARTHSLHSAHDTPVPLVRPLDLAARFELSWEQDIRAPTRQLCNCVFVRHKRLLGEHRRNEQQYANPMPFENRQGHILEVRICVVERKSHASGVRARTMHSVQHGPPITQAIAQVLQQLLERAEAYRIATIRSYGLNAAWIRNNAMDVKYGHTSGTRVTTRSPSQ